MQHHWNQKQLHWNQNRRTRRKEIVLAALLSGGVGVFATPAAHAAGTAANTVISNTATATYNDPNNAGTTLNATSNTVTVTVAEVAGITVGAVGVTDTTHPGTVLPGDAVNYDFVVTNIGNAANTFDLPGAATVTGSGTAGPLQYSVNGGTSFTAIPSGGLAATASVAPGGTVIVRVPITINSTANTGDVVKVQLGNTGSNDNAADTQNIGYPDAATGNDVYTNSATAQNGKREASFYQSGTVGTSPQALALILLTRTGFTQGATPSADTLTYGLELKVNSALPTGANTPHALTPADLVPTSISLNGASAPRVLISDAISAGTVLASVAAAPSGWVTVYSVTPTTTNANAAAWTTTAPTNLSTVTRVGFVNPNTVVRTTDTTGFLYTVTTTGASATTATTVNNVAQVFGQTNGDTTNALVFDESGDQDPSDFNSDGSRGSGTVPSGVALSTDANTDPGNNNTGAATNPSGSDNTYVVAPSGVILNGPNGQPGATGPTSSDDDFTNQSAPIPAGTQPGSTISPAAVVYTNTVKNPGTTALGVNTLLLPVPPSAASALPTGTTVTLAYGGSSAVYTYNGTLWTLTSGTQIAIPSIAAGASASYTATVQLPAGTPLSTDTSAGFPVTIEAAVDSNSNGTVDAGEPTNKTIDQTYTGFLRVTKRAQIVAADGTTIIQAYAAGPLSGNIQPGYFIDYRTTYNNISTPLGAGTNDVVLNASGVVIADDGTLGTNNWALAGPNGVSLTSNVASSAIDSGGGTITFFSGNPATTAATTTTTGTTPATDVTKYLDTISGTVPPGSSRNFTFRRHIN